MWNFCIKSNSKINISEALKESEHSNKDLNRSLQDALSAKNNLQNERESLLAELNDARDFIRDLEARLEGATSQLNVLRLDYDTKLRERDEEIENQRLDLKKILYSNGIDWSYLTFEFSINTFFSLCI